MVISASKIAEKLLCVTTKLAQPSREEIIVGEG